MAVADLHGDAHTAFKETSSFFFLEKNYDKTGLGGRSDTSTGFVTFGAK